MNRRSLLATIVAGGTIPLAGCSQQTDFTTEPTGLDKDTRTELNYQISSYTPYEALREFEVGPITQTARILLHAAVYQSNSSSVEETNGVGFLTIPTATVAGRSLNPLSSADPEEVVSLFSQTTSQFNSDNLEKVETYSQRFSLTDSDEEVTVFRTQISGSSIVEVYLRLHVATLQLSEDTDVYVIGFHIENQEVAEQSVQRAFNSAVNPSEELQNQDVEPKPLRDLIGGTGLSQ